MAPIARDDEAKPANARDEVAAMAASIDPVEAALAAGITALAAAMATTAPGDIVALADRMSSLARELEARRLARCSNVIDLAAHTKRVTTNAK